MDGTLEARIAARYGGLSARLRGAADYVRAHPLEIATRSLRAVAADSGASPATFSRLARALDFTSYEQLRETCRGEIAAPRISFSDRAARLQSEAEAAPPFLHRQTAAAVANLERQANALDAAQLDAAAALLVGARQVVVIGSASSAGAADYLAYLGGWLAEGWRAATDRGGAPLSMALADLQTGDVVVVITKAPFAARSIAAARAAAASGAAAIVITDGPGCPALADAAIGFLVPSDSPQFFSSYAATITLIEALIGLATARAGVPARARIAEVERLQAAVGAYADAAAPL